LGGLVFETGEVGKQSFDSHSFAPLFRPLPGVVPPCEPSDKRKPLERLELSGRTRCQGTVQPFD